MKKWRASTAGKSLLQPALTPSEQQVRNQLRREGWLVLRNGWPDFLAVRNGEIRLIEVKSGNGKLTIEQKRLHKALRALGVEVEVIHTTRTTL